MTCEAQFGWSFKDYSLLAGQQYRLGQRALWAFEFQYDRYGRSCIEQKKYCGIGVNYSFNKSYKELGLKVMWNPTRLTILASRSTKFYPYLVGQVNYIQTNAHNSFEVENKFQTSFGFRPGLGITGNFRENKVLSIRTYLQLGYNIPFENSQNFSNSLTLELKLGFGINTIQLIRNQQKDIETNPINK